MTGPVSDSDASGEGPAPLVLRLAEPCAVCHTGTRTTPSPAGRPICNACLQAQEDWHNLVADHLVRMAIIPAFVEVFRSHVNLTPEDAVGLPDALMKHLSTHRSTITAALIDALKEGRQREP